MRILAVNTAAFKTNQKENERNSKRSKLTVSSAIYLYIPF